MADEMKYTSNKHLNSARTCRKLGEKATVTVIPNTGHLPQQENPKLFNKILLDFLLHPAATSNGSAAAK